jgi:hypothetical protein
MSDLSIVRAGQQVMSATFVWNFNDTMDDTAGVSKDFGATSLSTTVDAITLPPGAIVVGGNLAVTTAFDTASYAVIVGDSLDTDRYLATADRKAVASTALLTPGYVNTTGLPIRITITNADACTTGQARLTVQFITSGRATENL